MASAFCTRRELVTLAAAGVGAASFSGWMGPLARHAAAQTAAPETRRSKSCILLWMDGGPSHIDTFDPKPDAPENIRGEYGSIATAITGVRICERLPKLALLMRRGAILRGMSTEEADHGRARVHLHTGYRPGAGGLTYPTLGSTVSAELGRSDSPLPHFVALGTPMEKAGLVTDAGYRGAHHQPLVLHDISRGIDNLQPLVPRAEFDNRAGVLEELEQGFARTYRSPAAEGHHATLGRALQLMRSNAGRVFDLSQEPARMRDLYGSSRFGQQCLLARRLVEAGIAFVEIYLGSWDSHDRRSAENVGNHLTQVNQGAGALLSDLDQRGLLQDTLVIWMGEFGRTPQVNNNGGRDHYPRAWSTVLWGGGVKGGQVVGATDARGAAVTNRPIAVRDFMATVCRLLGIDYTKRVIAPGGRPVRIVEDNDVRLIDEVI